MHPISILRPFPNKSRACMEPSLTRCGRETWLGPQGNTPSPSKCTGTPLAGNMHPHVWVGCKHTASRWSVEHPSHICHLWRSLHPRGYLVGAAFTLKEVDHVPFTILINGVQRYFSNWKYQTETWPNLKVSAIHQEARLSYNSHILPDQARWQLSLRH